MKLKKEVSRINGTKDIVKIFYNDVFGKGLYGVIDQGFVKKNMKNLVINFTYPEIDNLQIQSSRRDDFGVLTTSIFKELNQVIIDSDCSLDTLMNNETIEPFREECLEIYRVLQMSVEEQEKEIMADGNFRYKKQ